MNAVMKLLSYLESTMKRVLIICYSKEGCSNSIIDPVHTYMFTFVNVHFCIRLGLSSTRCCKHYVCATFELLCSASVCKVYIDYARVLLVSLSCYSQCIVTQLVDSLS